MILAEVQIKILLDKLKYLVETFFVFSLNLPNCLKFYKRLTKI